MAEDVAGAGSRARRSEPDSSPSRRAAKLCRPASIVVLQRRAADVGQGPKLAHQPAARGDLDPRRAGPAAQPLLHHLLEAFLADLEAGRDQQRVAVLGFIFLAGWACRHSRSDGRPRRLPDSSGRRRAAATRRAARAARTLTAANFSNGEMLGDRHRLEARGRARARVRIRLTSSAARPRSWVELGDAPGPRPRAGRG